MHKNVAALLDSSDIVPSAPEIVTRLVEVTNNPNYKLADVVDLLQADPGVVTDIMRVVNSSLFAGGTKPQTLSSAIIRLGTRQIRMLVLGRSMIGGLKNSESSLIDSSYFWRRSLATGVLAARFAERIASVERDQAFLVGLLCDIGIVILARALPDEYVAIARVYAPRQMEAPISEEVAAVGVTHAEIGAMIMERWSFPENVIAAVRYHHHDVPPNSRDVAGRMARIVNGAGRIARFLCEASADTHVRDVCVKAMDVAGLPLETLSEILEHVETDINEIAAGLGVQVIGSKVYTKIAQHVATELSGDPAGVS